MIDRQGLRARFKEKGIYINILGKFLPSPDLFTYTHHRNLLDFIILIMRLDLYR
jgi:hypothetical protein